MWRAAADAFLINRMKINANPRFGASLAPYAATWLQVNYGMAYVGYYLGAAAVITLICILLSGKDEV
jgi:hypothetical protein